MSGHTPGPWRDNGNPSLRRVIPVGSNSPIAGVHIRKHNAAEQAANARLIAAAPDLLDACKVALKQLLDLNEDLNQPNLDVMGWHANGAPQSAASFFEDNDHGAIEILEAAIAAAEGAKP